MTKTKNKLWGFAMLFVLAIFACSIVACGDTPVLELCQPDNIYEVTPGGELQFDVISENVDEEDIEFVVTAGSATIDQTGLLKVATDAQVSSTISVKAKTDKVESNTLTLNVVDLKPTGITINADNTMIAKGGKVSLDVVFTPTYATLTGYTLAITSGSQYADLNTTTNELTIKDTFDTAILDSEEVNIVVTATSQADATKTHSITIKVVDAEDISRIMAKNVNINTAKDSSNKLIEVFAYNELGQKLDVATSNYTFASSNENIAYVDADGKITPKGHGEAEITITSINGKTTKCYVYVMVPATQFEINNLNADILAKDIIFSYSKVDPLVLDYTIKNNNFAVCSNKVDYTFELFDDDDNVVESGDSVAVVTDEGIEFKKTGLVQVTIKTNSSLNNANTSSYEKSTSFLVDVNEGINIDTVAELVAYANQSENIVANINGDLLLDENNNFGKDTAKYRTLEMKGDRTINGNGYRISNEKLPLIIADGNNNGGSDMFQFIYADVNTPFTVKISNLEFLGCGGVDGIYNGTLSSYSDTDKVLYNANGDFIKTFKRGINIVGSEDKKNGNTSTAYAKDLLLDNVKITGFYVGLRMSHVVGELNNVEVGNCFTNGIESNQNILTINNITLGKVGAFGIEQTPDDMKDKGTDNPKGTAGPNFDQVSKLTMTGYIRSDNNSNGNDTIYMQNFTKQNDYSFNQILEALSSGLLQDYSNDIVLQATLSEIISKCLKNTNNEVNFYQLIFVDPNEFTEYDFGNTEGKFAEYAADSSTGNLINITEILANAAEAYNNGITYTGYKNYDYITFDLNLGGLGGMGNIGQVVLVNQAKEA